MQSKTTFKKVTGSLRHLMMCVALMAFTSSLVNAQTYTNGNLSTGATLSTGTAAPAGFTWSELQLTNTSLGFGANITAGLTIADDFTVPAGPSWGLTKATFYAYSTAYAGATSPYNDVRVQIYNTNPSVGTPTPIYGDLTTNRFAASSSANMYRTSSTAGTTRQIWKIEANISTILTPGTYWIEWQLGNGGLSNFCPPSTVVGAITVAGYNSLQRTLPSTWAPLTDGGSFAAADVPFMLNYTTGACAGTPAPGNTLASNASVCPGSTSTLSLQNTTSGTGVTYQWQSAAAATGPWTAIAGATSGTYTATPTATTFYQCVVTCSGNSGTSTAAQVALNPPSACYCLPAASNCSFSDVITNVTFGSSLNNNSTCSAGGYANYTSTVAATDIIAGATNAMRVTVGPGGTEYVGVWIDYDRSGTFDAAEFTALGSGNGVTISGNIAVPATATLGQTRMRVRVRWNTAITGTTACTTYTYGETEDYTVNLIPCIQGVYTTQAVSKTISCGGNTTFNVAAAGSLITYRWEYRTTATGVWLYVPNTGVYSGNTTNTLTIANAPESMNGYQFRAVIDGPCTATEFSAAATLTVTQLVATVSPASATICNGTIQQLTITNIPAAVPMTTTVSSGTINLAVPDNSPAGVSSTIPVALPAGAGTITRIDVKFTMPHTWPGDMVVVLKSPSGAVVNLDYFLSGTGGTAAGTGFLNTVISSSPTVTAALSSGSNPYTGIFKADASTAAGSGPTGFTPTVNNFPAVFPLTNANGNWTLAVYDGGAIDVGTLTSWSMDITYLFGAPATGVWGPLASNTIFTDAAATVPYTGTAVNSVYVKPAATTNYTVVVTTPTCVSGVTTVPVTVNQPLTGTSTTTNKSVCVAGSTSFTATLPTSGSPLSHQWKVSTDGGASFTSIANAGVYSGATTATLSITGATAAMNGYKYKDSLFVNVCNTFTNTNTVTLTVNPNPVIVLSANPFTKLYPGVTTTLSAAVSPNPGATYSWYRNGVIVPGATANTLVVDIDGLGVYTVNVNDVNGCNSTSSAIEIKEDANDILFIYPSPNTGQFQVRYYSLNGNNPLPRIINVFDSKGTRIFSKTYSINVPYSRLDVSLKNHGKGIYSVELSDANGRRLKTGRVVIL